MDLNKVKGPKPTLQRVSLDIRDVAPFGNPKISVIYLAARDAIFCAEDSLAGLLAQDYQNWEVIVLRPAPSVQAADAALGPSNSRLQEIGVSSENRAAAFNEGIMRANGDWLLFLDEHHPINPNHLSGLVSAVSAENEAGIILATSARSVSTGQVFLPVSPKVFSEHPPRICNTFNPFTLSSALIRCIDMQRVDGFDSNLTYLSEWDLLCRLVDSGTTVAAVEDVLAPQRLPLPHGRDYNAFYAETERILRQSNSAGSRGLVDAPSHILAVAAFRFMAEAIALGEHFPLHVGRIPDGLLRTRPADLALSFLIGLCSMRGCVPSCFATTPQETEGLLTQMANYFSPSSAVDEIQRCFRQLIGIELPQSSPQVSVVIPAYRAEETIGKTLSSVRSQTHKALDIIVVDDGSNDGTLAEVFFHAALDPRINIVSQINSGVAAARNNGWNLAAADHIAFVDADDLWAPTKIERQLIALEEEGSSAGLAYTWYARINAKCHITSLGHRPMFRGNVLSAILENNFIGNGSAALIKREALEKVGGFDTSLQERGAHGCEDLSIYFRIAEHYTFALVPEALTGYRVIPGNMSSNLARMFRSWQLVSQEMLSRHPDKADLIYKGLYDFTEWSILVGADRMKAKYVWELELQLMRRRPFRALWLAIGHFPRPLFRRLRGKVRSRIRRPIGPGPISFPVGSLPNSDRVLGTDPK